MGRVLSRMVDRIPSDHPFRLIVIVSPGIKV
ncbi:uncharacterized protein METZ01_LOCUS105925, partial [marine metagenome]